jgi:hypothetical protein
MKKIIYELNEVPIKLFDFYSKAFPNSAFAKLLSCSQLFETHTADIGGLSPWVTWPTMHRGISNVDHEISDLGQDLKKVNLDYPSVFNYLAKNDISVGVFGSLHSYPLPKNLDNYSFYVPDTFAAGSECFPEILSDFQRFNLSMVRANGRNVSKGIAVKDATKFILSSKKLGMRFSTFGKLTKQVINEQINKSRLVRRRTSQVEIAFDLFFKQQIDTRPDVSFFFTNHVASSMHRYWPTVFPEDYPDGKFDRSWLDKWKLEIPHSIRVANYQLSRLIKFCDVSNFELIVCSSMGQGAVKNTVPVFTQVLITNIRKLLRYLEISDNDWDPRLSMAPQVVVKPKSSQFLKKIKRLDNIFVNDQKINFFKTSTGDIRFEVKLFNVEKIYIRENDVSILPKNIGIENINLQDASNAYAYHIPQGIILNYKPFNANKNKKNMHWNKVSVLDFAPSLIKSFNVDVPGYMRGEKNILQY